MLSVFSGVIAIVCSSICPSAFKTPAQDFEEEDIEEEEDDDEIDFEEDIDSESDDEDIDAVIVNSMLHTLKVMRKNVKEDENRSGMKRSALIKRYQHARKRIMTRDIQRRKGIVSFLWGFNGLLSVSDIPSPITQQIRQSSSSISSNRWHVEARAW